jgi:hypothetical protein
MPNDKSPPEPENATQQETGGDCVSRLVRWSLSRDDDGDFQWDLLRTDGTPAATVWENGTWHTWDQDGTGGENSSQDTVSNAKMEALLSAINQGFLSANSQDRAPA